MKKLKLILTLSFACMAAGTLSAQTVTVSPTSLTFSALAGSSAQSQAVTVSGSTGVLFAISNQTWLKVCSGTACAPQNSTQINNGALTVFADPTGLSVGQYSGAVAIDNSSLQQVASVPVTFTVAPIGVSPSSLTFNYQIGSTYPVAQILTLSSAANTAYTTSLSGSDCAWLQQPPAGNAPGTVAVSVNTASLPTSAGNHSCTLQFIAGSQTVPVPISLVVAASPTLGVSPNPVNLFYQTGSTSSTNSASQTVTLSNPGAVALSFGINSNPSWLMVNPSQGTIPATGTTTVTLSYITSANLPVSSTPYQATLVIFASGASNNPIPLPVNLTISSSPLLNLNNAPVKFTYQVGGAFPNAQGFTATTTNAEANAATGQMQLAISATYASGGQWFSVPANATTGSTPILITPNPSVISTLAPGTYTGTVSVIGLFSANAPDAAHAIQIPVSLTVSNDPLIVLAFGSCTMTANNACPMNFPYETGVTTTAPSQAVTITSSNSNTLSSVAAAATMTAATNCTSSWLSVSPLTGAAGSPTFTVSANPAGIPNGTVCSGTVTVTANGPSGNASPNSPLSFPVKLYVSGSPMLVVNPISLSFTAAPNAGLSAFQNLNVTSTDSSTSGQILFSASSTSPSWLVFDGFTHTTPSAVGVAVNPSAASLTPGTYTGSITLTSAGALDSGLTVPVTLTITGASMTADKTALTFNQTLGGTVPASQNVTLSATGGTVAFTTSVGYQSGQPTGWLNATQSGTIASGATGAVAVSVNGSSLAAGTYNGTVTIAASGVAGSPITVNVTLVVAPGTLSVAPASAVFTEVQGTSAQSQNVQISGTPGALNFTVATSSNAPWLTATASASTTPATLQVTAANAGLQPGTYTGTVTVTSPGATGSPQTVNVTLTVVAAQTITVSPATLNFSYTIGTQTTLQAQTVNVSSSGGTAQFTATVSQNTGWLVVSPTTGATPAALQVSIQPSGLAAGTYTGTIAISSPSSATTPAATITVNLTVVAVPKPVVTAIQNAASAIAGPISPGENIVLYGTGIGPATLTMGTVSNNTLSNSAGQTQVFFDGVAAPVYYASSGQTSVFVPYGVAGRPSTQIVISFQGVQSNPITQTIAATVPGVYTANATGSGPAVAWNYDLNGNFTGINSASIPAVKGGVVSLYVTGEGVTNAPAGIDGMLVTTLYKPVATVTATVGGQNATVQYAGSAPGSIYGVMQVNVQIPATAPSGATALVINVGGNNSQSAVTIAIQ